MTMSLSDSARQNTDTKRYKKANEFSSHPATMSLQGRAWQNTDTNLYIPQNTKTLTSHPTTMPSSGRARAAARLLAPVKTPMSSTWKVSFATYMYYQQLTINRCDVVVKNEILFDLFRIEAANEKSVQVDALGSCHHSAPAFLVLHFLDDS